MAQLARRGLTSSTLVEVLIALVIIMVVLVMSIRLFTQLYLSGVSSKKVSITQHIRLLEAAVVKNRQTTPKVEVIDSIAYHLESYAEGRGDLMVLTITAKKDKVVLAKHQSYYRSNENN